MTEYDRSVPVTVVASAYDASGNGGRKITELPNGWIVSVENNAGTLQFQITKDRYTTAPVPLCSISGYVAGGYAITCSGTVVKVVWTDASHVYFNSFDSAYVSNTDQNGNKVTVDTLTGIGIGISFAIDAAGKLYTAYPGTTSTYPNSTNIRYAESTDGITWVKTQITTFNNNVMNCYYPCIAVRNNAPFIFYWCNNSSDSTHYFYVITTSYIGAGPYEIYYNGATGWHGYVLYKGGTENQYGPSVVVSPNGNIHLAMSGSSAAGAYRTSYFVTSDGAVNWSSNTDLTGNTASSTQPSITADGLSVPYIVYVDGGTLKWIKNTGSWSSPITIGTGSNPSTCEYSNFTKPMTLFMGASDVEFYGKFISPDVTDKVFLTGIGVTGRNAKSINKTCTATVRINRSIAKVANKFLTSAAKISGAVVRGRGYEKVFNAKVSVSVTTGRGFVHGKIMTAYVSLVGTTAKIVNKALAGFIKISYKLRRALTVYKQLYPVLTVTEYPIELSITEYPMVMEVLGMPKAGSTITLKGVFPDSAGDLTLLADVTVKVYGPGKVLLATITDVTEVSTGIYSAEYTIPEDKIGQFDFEFSGTLGSKTIVGRSSFDSIWK